MSIAPAEGFPPSSAQSESASVGTGRQVRPAPAVAHPPIGSVSGTPPKQETPVANSAPTTYDLPPDVVEVHQDPVDKSQVIIQYLNQSGNVVLQVPSNQELGVERGIAQDFVQAAKLRARGSEGEEHHGD
ncbi:MAG: hypothetical protein ABSB87_02900 [Terriglobales bacterium]|jgi:hypothetical protein